MNRFLYHTLHQTDHMGTLLTGFFPVELENTWYPNRSIISYNRITHCNHGSKLLLRIQRKLRVDMMKVNVLNTANDGVIQEIKHCEDLRGDNSARYQHGYTILIDYLFIRNQWLVGRPLSAVTMQSCHQFSCGMLSVKITGYEFICYTLASVWESEISKAIIVASSDIKCKNIDGKTVGDAEIQYSKLY